MENKLTVSAAPHITNKYNHTRVIMLDVIIALMPCLIAACIFFGIQVLINTIVCIFTCVLVEILFNMVYKKEYNVEVLFKSSITDCSAIVTGIILALNLPSVMNIWGKNIALNGTFFTNGVAGTNAVFSFDAIFVCIIGSIFAIALVKMLFGGLGKNFANPAGAARVFLFICFGLSVVNTVGSLGMDSSTGATWLAGNGSTSNKSIFFDMFIGNRGSAAVGETSIIAILIGYIYLSIRRVIDFRIPLIIIGSVAVFSFLLDGLVHIQYKTPARLMNNVFANVMSGGVAFAAVFMATDYSTTPNTFRGNVIFGVGFAFITVIIRSFGQYPEGASFALIIMNVITPLIDRYIYPKPQGYVKADKMKDIISGAKIASANKEDNA